MSRRLSKDEFISAVSAGANYIDEKIISDVYYSMIRVLSRELRGKHVVEMPDWGEFRLTIRKSRRMVDVNSKSLIVLPPLPEIRYTPDRKVRKYFHSISKNQ